MAKPTTAVTSGYCSWMPSISSCFSSKAEEGSKKVSKKADVQPGFCTNVTTKITSCVSGIFAVIAAPFVAIKNAVLSLCGRATKSDAVIPQGKTDVIAYNADEAELKKSVHDALVAAYSKLEPSNYQVNADSDVIGKQEAAIVAQLEALNDRLKAKHPKTTADDKDAQPAKGPFAGVRIDASGKDVVVSFVAPRTVTSKSVLLEGKSKFAPGNLTIDSNHSFAVTTGATKDAPAGSWKETTVTYTTKSKDSKSEEKKKTDLYERSYKTVYTSSDVFMPRAIAGDAVEVTLNGTKKADSFVGLQFEAKGLTVSNALKNGQAHAEATMKATMIKTLTGLAIEAGAPKQDAPKLAEALFDAISIIQEDRQDEKQTFVLRAIAPTDKSPGQILLAVAGDVDQSAIEATGLSLGAEISKAKKGEPALITTLRDLHVRCSDSWEHKKHDGISVLTFTVYSAKDAPAVEKVVEWSKAVKFDKLEKANLSEDAVTALEKFSTKIDQKSGAKPLFQISDAGDVVVWIPNAADKATVEKYTKGFSLKKVRDSSDLAVQADMRAFTVNFAEVKKK